MARPRQWPPRIIHDLKTGRDRVRLYDAAGRPHWHTLGPHGSAEAKDAYRRLFAGQFAAEAAIAPGESAGLTISILVGNYLAAVQPTLDARELWHTRRALNALVARHGTTLAAEFGSQALDQVRSQILTDALASGQRLSGRYVNRMLARMRRVIAWAAEMELVPADWPARWRLLKPLRKGDRRVIWRPPVQDVPEAVVAATLPYMHAILRDMVQVQALAGARPGELCRLCPGEIDRQGVDVDGARVWIWTPARHKKQADKPRRIPLGPQAQDILLPYLERPADAPCFSPAEAVARRRRVKATSTRRPGTRYAVGSYCHAIAAAVRRGNRALNAQAAQEAGKAGQPVPVPAPRVFIPGWSPHQLRHLAATKIQAAMGLEDARATLGHEASIITTLYAHADLHIAARVAAKLG